LTHRQDKTITYDKLRFEVDDAISSRFGTYGHIAVAV